MTAIAADTHPEAERVMFEILRRMSPGQRLERALDLRKVTLDLARARIRRSHPGITPREEMLRLASLWLDAETMRRVWGWDPDQRGR
jgi:hypothetical protein